MNLFPGESRLASWLRRRMPVVAVAAAALVILSVVVGGHSLVAESFVGGLLGLATGIAVLATLLYYGYRLARRFTDVLLWRVRRRLMVTYLFIGLTPIVLMTVLAIFAAFGVSAESMAHTISVQLELMTEQAQAAARTLAQELANLPASADNEEVRRRAARHVALLEASLPGVRVSIWSARGRDATSGAGSVPLLIRAPSVPDAGGLLFAETEISPAALPSWLEGRQEWSGLTHVAGTNELGEFLGVSALRALSRGEGGSRSYAVLLEVPVDATLAERLQGSTGLQIQPAAGLSTLLEAKTISPHGEERAPGSEEEKPDLPLGLEMTMGEEDVDLEWDGTRLGGFSGLPYMVVVPSSDWSDGSEAQHVAFLFNWTPQAAIQSVLGSSLAGRIWQQGLLFVGVVFLGLELLAVLAAVWMTRSVTGAVRGLHQATTYIKQGDFSHRVYLKSRDQLGDLAEAFNDMAAHVESLLDERVRRERLEREVEIAAQVQAGLFPRQVPLLGTIEVAGECRAARGVGGDYYDYMLLAPGRLLLALGDVAGKGISASLLMSNLQASLRALAGASAANGNRGVAQITSSINEQLFRSTATNRFATLFLADYDESRRLLTYTNAGHCPAILLRPDGGVERLKAGGMLIGSFEDARYEQAEAPLEPGSLLVLFSDGISEASAPEGEEYGDERLVKFVMDHRGLSAEELQASIFAEVGSWTRSSEREDDQTLVIVRAKST